MVAQRLLMKSSCSESRPWPRLSCMMSMGVASSRTTEQPKREVMLDASAPTPPKSMRMLGAGACVVLGTACIGIAEVVSVTVVSVVGATAAAVEEEAALAATRLALRRALRVVLS